MEIKKTKAQIVAIIAEKYKVTKQLVTGVIKEFHLL